MKRLRFLLPFAIVSCQPAGDPSPSELPTPKTIGVDYADWPSVTERPYSVAPAFIKWCEPPTPEEKRASAAEQKERGPHGLSAVVVRVSPTGEYVRRTSCPAASNSSPRLSVKSRLSSTIRMEAAMTQVQLSSAPDSGIALHETLTARLYPVTMTSQSRASQVSTRPARTRGVW